MHMAKTVMELCMGEGKATRAGALGKGPPAACCGRSVFPGSLPQAVNFENIPLKPENLFINHTWLPLLICVLKIRIKSKYIGPAEWRDG